MEALINYLLQFGNLNKQQIDFIASKSTELVLRKEDYFSEAGKIAKQVGFVLDGNPNVKRAVIEGLRIWTSRPYFKENPTIAIQLISNHKSDNSEYLRKSVGNALRDIGKKHTDKVLDEISTWDLTNKKTAFTYKLAKGK